MRSLRIYRALVLVMCWVLPIKEAHAQRIAVSTDAVELLALSPNVSFDLAFTQHHAFSVSLSASPWKISPNVYLRHLTWTPEYKYWLTMPFYKGYVGGKIMYSSYDFGVRDFTRKGNIVAALANYGYSFIVGKRWNIVPSVGLGAGCTMSESIKYVPVITLGVNAQIVLK